MRHRAEKPFGIGRYASGQKRCQGCDQIYTMGWNILSLLRYRLRTKPRNWKFKAKLKARKEVGESTI